MKKISNVKKNSPKKVKESIFKLLFEKKICFAVNIGMNTFKCIDESSKDYFLIVLKGNNEGSICSKKDFIEFKNLGLKETRDYPNIYEHELSSNEISEFKKIQEKFIKVVHNQHGRVYELKNKSFKDLYNFNLHQLAQKHT